MQDMMTFISNHLLLSAAVIVILILLIIIESIRLKRSKNISPAQAIQMINHQKAVVIDIRPIDTYRNGHIIDAVSLPAQEIKEAPKKLEKFKARPLLIVCNAGIESQKITTFLLNQGYNACSLSGGMRSWNAAEMPIVKDKP